ncbi:amidase family protein [Candidatus Similichlamydia laticola]|uniref:Glutamyl-tRNA(Gln) amidotransferase subunit A n=1 Tax=Candidatus Similichlamydia laticola TaxID=2170265 RepID=A0A369KCZ0_9BACT|nr:amidase family protein [Candidatus Similichlamydia laticola]RDB31472.1 Aspartyl-tRNA(Asn)-Glutamyl-tRNA(Gln) amidotransferase subunit A [Candidatus Similichlamydia laticola]
MTDPAVHAFSAKKLNQCFKEGSLSAEKIAIHFLNRIQTIDPQVKAFLSVFEDVVEQARQLDKKRALGKPYGKFAGVPVSVKDLIHIRGKKTTCASKFLENYTAPFNATVIDYLQREDALLIGKVNLDEFGMGALGKNSAFQVTCNPWNIDYFAGGSSSGSAASVAARMCPLSLGSDTGGSIRLPASFCGVYGFKPSYGSVSRYGLVSFASSLEQIGFLSHSAEDLKMFFSCINQKCSFDAQWRKIEEKPMALHLKDVSIGWTPALLESSGPTVSKTIHKAKTQLEQAGAKFVPLSCSLDAWKNALLAYHVICSSEASTNLARFDGIRFGNRITRPSFWDTISVTRSTQLGQEVKSRILTGTYYLSAMQHKSYYRAALEEVQFLKRLYRDLFNQVDLILMPASSCTAIPIGTQLSCTEQHLLDIYTCPANLAGLASLSFPVAICDDGLPMGCQLLAPQGKDYSVLELASQINSLFTVPAPTLDFVK